MTAVLSCDDALRFFEFAPDICCLFGADGSVIAANPAAEAILGYSLPELQRIPVADLTHPDDRPVFDEALQAALAGARRNQTETRFRTAGGGYRWLLWHAVAANGQVFATARDITEAKNREDERFRRLFETSKDCILLLDAVTGVILECNGHTQELLGYSKDKLRGLPIWQAPGFQAGDVGARLFGALRKSDIYRSEEELTVKAGEKVAVELLCNRYRDGALERIQANIRDISERKRAETALRESEDRFRVLVEGVRDYAIFMTDSENKIISWNRGAERILGYLEHEILGVDSALLFTPEDRERVEPEREMATALREGRAEDERWHLRKMAAVSLPAAYSRRYGRRITNSAGSPK